MTLRKRSRRLVGLLTGIALTVSLGGCYGAPVASQNAASTSGGMGSTCYAGAYVCPLLAPGARGTTCSCPGLGAPSYGVIN